MKDLSEWATIGKIVAPFGLRGDVKVFPLSDVPERFSSLRAVYIAPDYRRCKIQSVRPYKGSFLLVKLAGINDATAAEVLRQHDLCIPVSEMAQLPPDSYYQHDILGLQVRLLDNRSVGVISEIIASGAQDVYVIRSESGEQFLIPAVKEFIKQVDLIRHVMYIDPIKGLIDDEAIIDTADDVDSTMELEDEDFQHTSPEQGEA